jgi:hypothetical protein
MLYPRRYPPPLRQPRGGPRYRGRLASSQRHCRCNACSAARARRRCSSSAPTARLPPNAAVHSLPDPDRRQRCLDDRSKLAAAAAAPQRRRPLVSPPPRAHPMSIILRSRPRRDGTSGYAVVVIALVVVVAAVIVVPAAITPPPPPSPSLLSLSGRRLVGC